MAPVRSNDVTRAVSFTAALFLVLTSMSSAFLPCQARICNYTNPSYFSQLYKLADQPNLFDLYIVYLSCLGASRPLTSLLTQRPLLSCHMDKHCIIQETCWIYCRSKGFHGGKGALCKRNYRPWVCCCLQDQAL